MDRNDAMQIVVVIVYTVALRKESVDRNDTSQRVQQPWGVALRKESVDRNTNFSPAGLSDLRRSPQGERG